MIKIKHRFEIECDTLEEAEYSKAQAEQLGYKVEPSFSRKKFAAECYEERELPNTEVQETPEIKEI